MCLNILIFFWKCGGVKGFSGLGKKNPLYRLSLGVDLLNISLQGAGTKFLCHQNCCSLQLKCDINF